MWNGAFVGFEMSHPPPAKKRYYYQDGGAAHAMRHGGPFAKKSYGVSGGYSGVAGGSAEAQPPAPASEPARTSRYDPSAPSRPMSGRSRYNPESEGEMAAYADDSGAKSRYSGSRYNSGGVSRQTRPRSMEMDVPYQYSSGPANGSVPTSAASYYSRSNKWRSPSGSKLDYESYNGATTRPPFWKSQRSKFSTAPAPAPAVSGPTGSPVLEPVSRPNRYNNPTPTVTPNKDSSEDSEAPSEARSSNPNSLGSSLINSVTQTTRRVERQHAADHKRIHLERPASVRSSDEEERKPVVEEEIVEEKKEPSAKSDDLWKPVEKLEAKKEEPVKEDVEQQKPVFQAEKSWIHDDYEFIHDLKLSKTNIQDLSSHEPMVGYSVPMKPIGACIFPLSRAETKLWELKNRPREEIIKDQKYLLKNPIKSTSSYPFIQQNVLIHRQAVRPLLCQQISILKRYEYRKKLQLRKQFLENQETWETNCRHMDEMSREMRKEELERKEREELEEKERERQERETAERKASGSSRRRNRADFVDDTEIENVLLQIDPDYKHHQQAAEIPPMINAPVQRYAMKFKNVNNLVTDKNAWASRIMKDRIDTFTQDEHELFVEGYLTYPKKFGKISLFMGALRSPEECVMHYYGTKNSVDYKKLLNDRNKKRQKGAIAKRRKKKERSSEIDHEIPSMVSEAENAVEADEEGEKKSADLEEQVCEKPSKQMQQVEIKVPSLPSESNAVVEEKPSDLIAAEAVNQQSTQDDAIDVNGEANDLPRTNIETESTSALKRPHEDLEIETDAGKSILEDNGTTYDIVAPEPSHDEGNMDAVVAGQENPDSYQSGAMQEEHLHRKRQKSTGDHKSSYWSVKEANLFPELLKQFGSQWSLISDKLGTKSTTMVRNYYQRNAAQLGWKPVVEEADFKRNATSSGSVQQSQILIQAEQNSIPPVNGIPPQQRPALGFFSNQIASEKRMPYDVSTPPQPFIPDMNKDSFSQAFTPNNTLPPPRLPSIQLPGTTRTETKNTEVMASRASVSSASPVESLLSKNEKPLGFSSSINSILNNPEKNEPFSPSPAAYPPAQVPQIAHLLQNQQTSAIRPNIGSVMVQELQKSSSSSPRERRSSSLSLLLNPESQKPPQLAAANPKNNSTVPVVGVPTSYPPVSQSPRGNFNFAMDPLGVLAAIASESLHPTQGAQINGNQDSKG